MAINNVLTRFLLTTLFFASAYACYAQQDSSSLTFGDWDKNGNQIITRSEFIEVFMENYVRDWNDVDDPYLDDEDFYQISYKIWDSDKDSLLSKDEWLYGYDYFYGKYISDDYVTIDKNNDGYIEFKEYYNVIYPSGYYVSWDVNKDAYLSEYELARMIFNNWDTNNTNFIEKDEYEELSSYYLDF